MLKDLIVTPEIVWARAKTAAQAAAQAQNEFLGPEQSRGLDCGFAWVAFNDGGNSPMVRWLKKTGKYGGHKMGVWYSDLHTVQTQSVSVHLVACQAAHRVFADPGYGCHVGSALD